MFEACGQHIAWPLSRFAAAVLLRDIYTLDSWRMLEGSPLPLEGSAITEVGTQNSEWTLWLSTCIRGLWVFKTQQSVPGLRTSEPSMTFVRN